MVTSVPGANTARAQLAVGDDARTSFCLQAPGGYVLTGVSLWPAATGMALTSGAFHNRLFGVEVGAWVPRGGDVDQEGVLGSMVAGRVTLMRTALDGTTGPAPGRRPRAVVSRGPRAAVR